MFLVKRIIGTMCAKNSKNALILFNVVFPRFDIQLLFLPRDAKRTYYQLSVCQSVCLYVTLVYRIVAI